MEDRLKLLEEQVNALKELVSIKDQIINELKTKQLPQTIYIQHLQPSYQPQQNGNYWQYPITSGAISGGYHYQNQVQHMIQGSTSGQNYTGNISGISDGTNSGWASSNLKSK